MSSSNNNHTMRDGLPTRYWRFRNLVSIGQIAVVVLLMVGAAIWATTDGNGVRLWSDYLHFSQGVSDFAHNQMKLPWE